MVRIPTDETPPYVLHVSDCLDNLKPGDHIEIQWKGSEQTPSYGMFNVSYPYPVSSLNKFKFKTFK